MKSDQDEAGQLAEKPKGGVRKRRPATGIEQIGWRLPHLHWYAVMVKAGCEFPVADLLQRRGLYAVVPEITVWRAVNKYVKRKHKVTFSLLPRYVLVGFPSTSSYTDEVRAFFELQRDLTLIQSVVGMDGLPRRLNGTLLAHFLRGLGHISAPDAQRYMRTHAEFGEGDEVLITEGAFEGWVVRVHEIRGAVAEVLMPLFKGTAQSVRVPLANLEKSA